MDYEERLRRTQEAAEEEEEIEDSESDNDEKDSVPKVTFQPHQTNISEEEKHMFKEEFLSHMYQSFLDGHDKEFNYRCVCYEKVNVLCNWSVLVLNSLPKSFEL